MTDEVPLPAFRSAMGERDVARYFSLLAEAVAAVGMDETLAQVRSLQQSGPSKNTRLALDVLAVAIDVDPGLYDVVVAAALTGHGDDDPDVRWSAAHLLASLGDERAAPALVMFAADDDSDVRWQVTYGLAETTWTTDVPAAVRAALLSLTRDRDAEVRDWATFALGVESPLDDAEVRAALRDRLSDQDNDAAGEALLALAIRRDDGVLRLIDHRLRDGSPGNLVVMAARAMGDPDLCDALRRLQASGWIDRADPGLLDDTLDACGCGSPDA